MRTAEHGELLTEGLCSNKNNMYDTTSSWRHTGTDACTHCLGGWLADSVHPAD